MEHLPTNDRPAGIDRHLCMRRALDSGHTLSDYVLAELERLAGRPTREEMLAGPSLDTGCGSM